MYKVIPMTRLGLEAYQGKLSNVFKQINRMVYKGEEVFRFHKKAKCSTEQFPEGHFIYPGSFIVKSDVGLEGVKADILQDGVVQEAEPLKLKSKIAFLDGKNCAPFCSEPFNQFFNAYGLNVDIISDLDVRSGILKDYEILIVPGGPDAGESYYEGLGELGFNEIKSFVQDGGLYLGSCAGSYFPLSAVEETPANDVWLNMLPVTDVCGLDYWRTGTGFVRVEIEDPGHPVTYGLAMGAPSTLDMIYWEGPAFEILNSDNIRVIARYKDFIASGKELPSWSLENNPVAVEAMKWSNPLTRDRFKEHLEGVPAIIEASCGKGHMVLISPHAEFGDCGTDHAMEDNTNYLLLMNSLYYLSGLKGK